jgi:hypothetical protein
MRLVCPALCIGLVSALASCGSGSSGGSSEPLTKQEYRQALVQLYVDAQAVGDAYDRLQETGLSSTECAQRAHAYTDLISSLIERLGDLDPPADARNAQAKIVAGGRASVDRFERVADRAEAGELRCGPEFGRVMLRGESDSANEAFHELQDLGYATFD